MGICVAQQYCIVGPVEVLLSWFSPVTEIHSFKNFVSLEECSKMSSQTSLPQGLDILVVYLHLVEINNLVFGGTYF